MPGQFVQALFSQNLPQNCIADLTPPTFAGVSTLVAQTDGGIEVQWLAGSTTKPDLSYLVYIALGVVTAPVLFQDANVVTISRGNKAKVYTLADLSTYLVKGSQYTFGVRAKDALDISETNTVVQTVVALSSGNIVDLLQTATQQLSSLVSGIVPASIVGTVESAEITGIVESEEVI